MLKNALSSPWSISDGRQVGVSIHIIALSLLVMISWEQRNHWTQSGMQQAYLAPCKAPRNQPGQTLSQDHARGRSNRSSLGISTARGCCCVKRPRVERGHAVEKQAGKENETLDESVGVITALSSSQRSGTGFFKTKATTTASSE